MSLLSLDHVDKFFGSEQILDDVSFRVDRGDHVALVGANGAGKSTILRIMAGLDEADRGSVTRARGLRISYLPQDPNFEATDTLYDVMLGAFRDAIDAQEKLHEIEERLAAGQDDPDLVTLYGQ